MKSFPLRASSFEPRRTIEFAVVRDTLIEPPEDLTLTLSDPVGAILGSQIRATLTILDHPGGLVDETFHASLASSTNWDDGWSFTAFSSPARSGDGRVYSCASLGQGPLRRFLLNGAADPTFQPAISACPSAMVVQSDGRLLLSWKANVIVPPVVSNRIARLNLDGSMDASFHPDLGVDGTVGLLVLQANGEILVGGTFGSIGGIAQSNLARLHVDGSVDPSFAPVVPSNTLHQILLQPDGRILLGGTFTAINGFTRQGVARLSADGTLDPEFQPW